MCLCTKGTIVTTRPDASCSLAQGARVLGCSGGVATRTWAPFSRPRDPQPVPGHVFSREPWSPGALEGAGGSPTSGTTRPWTHPTDVPHRLASHHDMSTHRPTQDYRLYPAFCFQVSPTFNDWVKMTAADVQQLRREPDFMSSKSATRTLPTSLPPLLTHPSSSPHLLLSQSSYPIHTPRRSRRSNQRYQSKIRHPHPRRRQRRHHRSQDQTVRSRPAKSPRHLV